MPPARCDGLHRSTPTPHPRHTHLLSPVLPPALPPDPPATLWPPPHAPPPLQPPRLPGLPHCERGGGAGARVLLRGAQRAAGGHERGDDGAGGLGCVGGGGARRRGPAGTTTPSRAPLSRGPGCVARAPGAASLKGAPRRVAAGDCVQQAWGSAALSSFALVPSRVPCPAAHACPARPPVRPPAVH